MKPHRSRSFVRAVLAVACCSATLVSFMAAPPAEASEGEITQFTIPTPGSVPDGITAAPDGNLWFAERQGDKIGRITPSGEFTEFPLQADSQALALTVGPDGNIWFTEFESNKIGRITPSGAITEFAVPTPGSEPHGITVGPDGNLWFTELYGNNIARMTLDGQITEFPVPTANGRPSIITSGPDGNIWFAEWVGDKIGRITLAGDVTEFPTPTSGSKPHGITVGPDGNLWFTEFGGGNIGRITPSGHITEFPTPIGVSKPAFIATGADGNLWFTEYNQDKIGRITPTGDITEYAIPGSGPAGQRAVSQPASRRAAASFAFECEIWRQWLQGDGAPPCNGPACPIGIGLGPDGNLWFTEFDGSKIGRITDLPRTAITLTPRSGPPGTSVQVSGGGFGALEPIDLAFRDLHGRLVPLGSTPADGGGRLSIEVVIPTGASPGRQAIVARGAISYIQTSSPFLVT